METDRTRTNRAVTPVVGIVLIVAITILLAATVGAFVLGIDQPAEADQPTATFEFEDNVSENGSDTVSIEHTAGSPILAENLYVKVDGATCTSGSSTADGRYNVKEDLSFPGEEMSAGQTVLVADTELCDSGADLDLSDATITVVWENSAGDSGTYETWRPS